MEDWFFKKLKPKYVKRAKKFFSFLRNLNRRNLYDWPEGFKQGTRVRDKYSMAWGVKKDKGTVVGRSGENEKMVVVLWDRSGFQVDTAVERLRRLK